MALTIYNRRRYAAASAIGLVAAALVGCSPAPNRATDPSDGRSAPDAAPAVPLRPGQPIRAGDLTITLRPAELREQVGFSIAPETAADGGVLVLMRWSVANHSAKPVSAGMLPQIKLIDAQGVEYSPDAGKSGAYAMARTLDAKSFSDLNPGITVKNAAVFEVSKSTFDPKTWVAVMDGQKIALR
jgi:hypothetical protein